MFGGLCFRPLALADEGLGLTIDIEKSFFYNHPERGPTLPPRRAQPLLLLSRSNPPTEGGGQKKYMYHLSRRRAPPPALECPGECSATAQVVQCRPSLACLVQGNALHSAATIMLLESYIENRIRPTVGAGVSSRARMDSTHSEV